MSRVGAGALNHLQATFLRKLNLESCLDPILNDLNRFTYLTDLNLRANREFANGANIDPGSLRHLTRLNLYGASITDQNLLLLKPLPLQELRPPGSDIDLSTIDELQRDRPSLMILNG
jgi:hypothetical protein